MSKPSKMFLLKRLIRWNCNPCDENMGHVIRAVDELAARAMADAHCADEGQIWNNPDLVSCTEIPIRGNAEIILTSFNAG